MEKMKILESSADDKSSTSSQECLTSETEKTKDDHDSPGCFKFSHGLNVWLAVMFITGEMAGTGAVSLSRAVVNCGAPLGVVLLLLLAVVSCYTGILLGWCWEILEKRYEEYRNVHVQDPYCSIGYRAAGNWGRYTIAVCNGCSIFCGCVVMLILSSQMVHGVLGEFVPIMTPCLWSLVIAVLMIPVSWLGTPKDMWPIGVGATSTTVFACILIVTSIALLIPKTPGPVPHGNVEFKPFSSAFGVITFSYCGHISFPAIQHDMTEREKFPAAAALGYAGMLFMYLPVVLIAYFVLGDRVTDNVLTIIQRYDVYRITSAIQVLLFCHLVLAFHIVLNPLLQNLEKRFEVNEFGFRRVLIRTTVVLFVLFVAETLPRFGPVMSFVGGSFMNIICFIAPVIFYELLCRGNKEFPKIPIPLHMHVIHVEVLIIAVLAGVASCYSAINEIVAPGSFVLPCYLNTTSGNTHPVASSTPKPIS